MQRMILLRDLKFCWMQKKILKLILLGHQNNFVGTLKMSNAAKIWIFYQLVS